MIARTKVRGPLALLADGFRGELDRLGYTLSSREYKLAEVAKLSAWLESRGLGVADICSARLEEFLADLAAGGGRAPTLAAMRPVVNWLRDRRLIGDDPPPARGPLDALMERYRYWMVTDRQLAARTIGRYEHADADPGRQLIAVVRKGTRAVQQVPAAPDAFVWLRLYQAEIDGLVAGTLNEPLWWTLRRPLRALNYHAARAMFVRANAVLGADWTLHDLRHTAAYRMARDPEIPLTDVQWVLGHAHLSTTQLYVTAPVEDVIETVLAHHRRQRDQQLRPEPPQPSSGYRPETLDVLFGRPKR